MNEERIAAYLNLIQELLACPSGEENQILNQSSELLDEGFVMVVLAKSLQATIEGEDHPARFLKSLAEQVAEYIGMELPEIENPQGLGHLMQNAPVLETLQQFIQADTWSKSQEYLAQYPELLGDDVDALLSQLMEMVTEQERSVLQEHRDLLQRCREIGIEQGFEEKRANVRAARMQSAQAELPPELMELVEDPQMRELLENPQMMGLVQDIFGALQESNIAPDDLEISVRVRPELMGRVAEMAMGGTGLGNLLNAENSGDALTQFWKQLLQAEMQSGGDAAAVHQVMRPYMGLIVPALGDVIAQSMPGLLAQYPDQAEGVAGLVEDTCTSIRQFPYGRYAEALEIAIRGYDVVLALGVYSPQGRAQTLNNLGVARSTQAEMGIEPAENLQKAITAYNQAAEILRQPGLEKDLSGTLNNLGNARLTQAEMGIEPAENLQKAITAYNQAAEILRQPGLEKDLSSTLNNLGVARSTQAEMGIEPAENLQKAITAYNQAAEILRQPGLEKDLSGTLNNLGNARLTQAEMGIEPAENLQKAITAYNEAAEIRRQPGLEKDLSGTLNNLGVARSTQAEMGIEPAENLQKAITAYNQAAEILRQPGLEKDLSGTLNNLGNARLTQAQMGIEPAENLQKAITAYNEAAEIRRQPGLEKDLSSTLNNLGNARLTQAQMGIEPAENLQKAITAYNQAAEILRQPGLEKDLSSTLNNLGIARLTQAEMGIEPAENLQKAITAYNQAAEILRQPGLEKDLSSTLNNLGNARSTQAEMGIEPAENLQKAITAYNQAAEILRQPGLEKDLSSTLNNLGNARSTQAEMGIEPAENLQKAITAYNQAAEILRQPGLEKDLSSTLNNLGNARLTQAERGIEPAENLQKAITAYNQAAEILRQLGLARNLATTLNNFSFAYQAQSRLPSNSPDEKQAALDNAYRSFQEALDRVEYLRGEIGANSEGYKRNFNEEWNKVYRGMVEVCLELGRYQDAIEYADRSKARNLVELMATRDAYPGGVIPDDIRQQLQELRQTIAAEDYRLQKEKNPDRTHLDQLRQEFQKKFPYKPLHFQAMQELLDEETAILEWYILEDKFLTFTLTREKLYLWTSSQEDRQKLIGWTVAYLTDYRNRNNSQWRETLAQRLEELPKILHLDEILQNLFKNFPKCQKLILIPHLYLHLFPLHALPVHLPSSPNPLLPEGEKGANSPSSPLSPLGRGAGGEGQSSPLSPLGRGAGGEGKFLQDLFPKGVTYAPNCQLLQQAQSRPRFNFNQLFAIQNPTNDIKWADTQVETIRKFFPQRKTLGTKATKANFLAQDLSQTHHLFFSCHGSFKPNSLLNSGLILADGVLSLENIIAKLNLKECSLVTLSACETGQVALDQTDEYISIASGFLLAGSPRVLMSLWSVDEASTALLLIKTYELLQKQPGKLAQALPAAQKWLRETTNSGFYAWVQKSPLLDDHWRKHLAQVFQIEQNKEGADFRPYESPYHWAAFCVVGQGEQKMARDRDKIEAFEVLLGEDLDYLLAPYRQALDELQLGDDDEQNAQAIETWLATREPLYQEYQKQLATLTAANPLLGPTTEMGIGGSKANTKGSTLEELLSNIKKRNTPPPPPEKS